MKRISMKESILYTALLAYILEHLSMRITQMSWILDSYVKFDCETIWFYLTTIFIPLIMSGFTKNRFISNVVEKYYLSKNNIVKYIAEILSICVNVVILYAVYNIVSILMISIIFFIID